MWLILLGLILVMGLAVWGNFFQARMEREHHARSIVRLTEASITRTLASVEIALLRLAERGRMLTRDAGGRAALEAAVADTLRFSPHIRQILVARGETVLLSSHGPIGAGDVLGIQALGLRAPGAASFSLGLRIGNPLPGRYLPRRGDTPQADHHSRVLPVALAAQPLGSDPPITVYAALNPSFFTVQLTNAELGRRSAVGLWSLDGDLLLGSAEFPTAWPTGVTEALRTVLQHGEEQGKLPLGEDGLSHRRIEYQWSSRYPVAVLVLVDHRDTLERWWQESRYLFLLSALAVTALLLTGVFLIRELQRRLALQGHAQVLEQAVAQSATAVLVTDLQGRVQYCNEAYTTLTGFPAGEMLGRRLEVLQPDSQGIPREDHRLLERVQVWSGECLIRSKDGRALWILLEISPVRGGDGQPIHLVCTQVDISRRKQVEADLRIAATAFESREAMMVTDAHGVILRVNRAFSELTHYQAEEVVGKTPAVLHSERQDQPFYEALWDTLVQERRWQGELWNRRKNGEIYPQWLVISAVVDDQDQVTHYVANLTDISERKAAEREIQRLAFFDALTGLPNRRLLLDRLQHALAVSSRHRTHGALLFLDLDNFKMLNDTRGHQAGDELLVEAADRLGGNIRAVDSVARLGGDEFVVLLEGLDQDRQQAALQAQQVAGKILQTLHEPYRFEDLEHQCSASIGISLFHGEELPVDELLKQADVAMYRAKAAGGNTQRLFDPAMQVALEFRADLEQALRWAIPRAELRLFLQPQVDERRRLLGAEALIRWCHPELGLLPPGEFIGLAEESGLIVPMGYWVLETACQYLRAWQMVPETRHLSLAVNVSARQFHQKDFAHRTMEIIQGAGIDASLLKLELTESLMLHDVEETIAIMRTLKALGVGFSVDDFGTGQSSLAYLRALPLDQVKIDRSFVKDLPHDASGVTIVQTIIAMARSLNLEVIAEGVETADQAASLSHHGCRYFQGFLYGRPMTEADFREIAVA